MLVVAIKGREDKVREILAKWDLTAAVIGEVIAEPVYRVTEGDRVVAEFPGTRLVTDCPQYHPEGRESDAIAALRARDVHAIPPLKQERNSAWTLRRLLESPTIASKRWLYRQYDSTVRTNTVIGPGSGDAAVLRIRGTAKGLALKTDCNGRYVYLDPRVGGRIAVAEAARNVACVGARPMAITNCLNFGNPTRPDIFFQFREALAGMGEACVALGTPVTGGNVSFYNETPAGAVYPTPTIGMVGLLDDVSRATPMEFREAEDAIILLGEPTDELGASEYLAWIHGVVAGAPPRCDLVRERALVETLHESINAGLLHSAHDCSEGGFAVAMAECCIGNPLAQHGAMVDLSVWKAIPSRALLFGEAQGRAVVSTSDAAAVLAIAKRHGVPARNIGMVKPPNEGLVIVVAGHSMRSPLLDLLAAYHDAIPRAMERAPAELVPVDLATGAPA
jgi:phosphoribosylformylglycinamidine synthase